MLKDSFSWLRSMRHAKSIWRTWCLSLAGEVFAAVIFVLPITGTLVEYLLAGVLVFHVFHELILKKSDAQQRLKGTITSLTGFSISSHTIITAAITSWWAWLPDVTASVLKSVVILNEFLHVNRGLASASMCSYTITTAAITSWSAILPDFIAAVNISVAILDVFLNVARCLAGHRCSPCYTFKIGAATIRVVWACLTGEQATVILVNRLGCKAKCSCELLEHLSI